MRTYAVATVYVPLALPGYTIELAGHESESNGIGSIKATEGPKKGAAKSGVPRQIRLSSARRLLLLQ
jgi:hypothetical protein